MYSVTMQKLSFSSRGRNRYRIENTEMKIDPDSFSDCGPENYYRKRADNYQAVKNTPDVLHQTNRPRYPDGKCMMTSDSDLSLLLIIK